MDDYQDDQDMNLTVFLCGVPTLIRPDEWHLDDDDQSYYGEDL